MWETNLKASAVSLKRHLLGCNNECETQLYKTLQYMPRVHTAFSTVYTAAGFPKLKLPELTTHLFLVPGCKFVGAVLLPPPRAWICTSWGDLNLYTYYYNNCGKWSLDLFILTTMELQLQLNLRRVLTLCGSVRFCRGTVYHQRGTERKVFCLPFCVLRPSLSVCIVVKLYCLLVSTIFQFCGEADTNCLEQVIWRHSVAA
jgi:hypothetical protein